MTCCRVPGLWARLVRASSYGWQLMARACFRTEHYGFGVQSSTSPGLVSIQYSVLVRATTLEIRLGSALDVEWTLGSSF